MLRHSPEATKLLHAETSQAHKILHLNMLHKKGGSMGYASQQEDDDLARDEGQRSQQEDAKEKEDKPAEDEKEPDK